VIRDQAVFFTQFSAFFRRQVSAFFPGETAFHGFVVRGTPGTAFFSPSRLGFFPGENAFMVS
jgi:hypothetical protein